MAHLPFNKDGEEQAFVQVYGNGEGVMLALPYGLFYANGDERSIELVLSFKEALTINHALTEAILKGLDE